MQGAIPADLLELAEVALTQPKLPALEAARDHRRSARGSTQGSGGLPLVSDAAAECRWRLIYGYSAFPSWDHWFVKKSHKILSTFRLNPCE